MKPCTKLTKMNKEFRLFFLLMILPSLLFAQGEFAGNVKAHKQAVDEKPAPVEVKRVFDLGTGMGLDYGGLLGIKGTFVPIKYLGIFASVGYHLAGPGWQVGVTGYILPKTNLKKVRPYGKVMFGTNRVIIVYGASEYNKTYMGFTPGAGVEFRFGPTASHGLNIDLNIPVNSSKFNDDLDDLKNNPAIDISSPSPVTISLGYHFEF